MVTVVNKNVVVNSNNTADELPCRLCRSLPKELVDEIYFASRTLCVGERVEEIRLRSERRVYLTVGGRGTKRNLGLSYVLNKKQMNDILEIMCDGSLYAYSESIVRGYVSLGEGIRVGVCGRASVDGGRILGVYDISALNIRIPCGEIRLDKGLVDMVRTVVTRGEGALIYSPPAYGKTTMLKALAVALSGGEHPMRISVVDTRDELGSLANRKELTLDILSGYPKAEGIRIATAFMNPQVIMCDEIGDDEAYAIAEAQNCGVGLIATAHGADAGALLRRQGMEYLHRVNAFGLYVGIRIRSGGGFHYRVQKKEEVSVADNRNYHRMY